MYHGTTNKRTKPSVPLNIRKRNVAHILNLIRHVNAIQNLATNVMHTVAKLRNRIRLTGKGSRIRRVRPQHQNRNNRRQRGYQHNLG